MYTFHGDLCGGQCAQRPAGIADFSRRAHRPRQNGFASHFFVYTFICLTFFRIGEGTLKEVFHSSNEGKRNCLQQDVGTA